MADILIQFHALPEELMNFSQEIATEFDLHVTAMRFFPFAAKKFAPNEVDLIFAEDSPYSELAFTRDAPVLPVAGKMEFLDRNPGALQLGIQRVGKEGLRQTSLTVRTDDSDALSVWQQVAKRLKAITQPGVVVRNPDTGASVRNRAFRYSAGARSLADRGIAMLPIAGGNVVDLRPDSHGDVNV